MYGVKGQIGTLLTPTEPALERQERARLASRVARGIIENELPRRQRQVLVLYYQEQKTMKEIAKLLGVTPSCVSHTHRAACETVQNRLRAYHLY